MRKIIGTLALCATTSLANAQSISGNSTFVELEPVIGNGQAAMAIRLGKNWPVNEYTMVGFGVAISENLKFKDLKPQIPITVRGTFDDRSKDISPFLSMDLGYCVNTADFDMGSILLNPTVGVRVKNTYVGVGYHGSLPTKSNTKLGSSVNIRLGLFMDELNLTPMKSFFEKTFVTAELGAGVNASKYDSGHGPNLGSKTNSNKGADLTFNWLYKINENIAAGIGAGCRFNYHDHGGSQTAVPVYARGQYTVGNEGQFIRPFAAVNIGTMNYTGSEDENGTSLYFEPQVGVWFNDRFSLSVGYDPTAYYNFDEDQLWWSDEGYQHSYSQVTVRLGVKF